MILIDSEQHHTRSKVAASQLESIWDIDMARERQLRAVENSIWRNGKQQKRIYILDHVTREIIRVASEIKCYRNIENSLDEYSGNKNTS